MQTLRDIRPRSYKAYSGNIGIEVETEAETTYSIPEFRYWSAHNDGSLRNFGVEYVLSKPLSFGSESYYAALKEFESFVKANAKYKWLNSTYSSVHVHFNMADKTPKFITNFVTLYVLLENVLTRYCGPDRDGNLFCLKSGNAEESILLYQKMFFTIASGKKSFVNFIQYLNENSYKYSALNICPLKTLGSVEVRTHGGTTNVEEINMWVSMLFCLYSMAGTYNNPKEVFDDLRLLGSLKFVDKIFDEYAQFLTTPRTEEDVESTYFYAKSLLYSVNDWEKFGIFEDKKLFMKEEIPSKFFIEEGFDPIFYINVSTNNVTTFTTIEDQ